MIFTPVFIYNYMITGHGSDANDLQSDNWQKLDITGISTIL